MSKKSVLVMKIVGRSDPHVRLRSHDGLTEKWLKKYS
jgi:hypothetical protein